MKINKDYEFELENPRRSMIRIENSIDINDFHLNLGNAEREEFPKMTILVSRISKSEFPDQKWLGKSDLKIRTQPGTLGKSVLEITPALCSLGFHWRLRVFIDVQWNQWFSMTNQ